MKAQVIVENLHIIAESVQRWLLFLCDFYFEILIYVGYVRLEFDYFLPRFAPHTILS